jgi:ubiquinone/menaquinone biosynthesis C-methylase UbiE
MFSGAPGPSTVSTSPARRSRRYSASGVVEADEFRFPYPDNSFDVVFAASIFTHMGPRAVAHYLVESARVLRPGGFRAFSFLLLDNYLSGHPRPLGFGRPSFDFEHRHPDWDDRVAIVEPRDPEKMTAYAHSLVRDMAESAGLELCGEPLPVFGQVVRVIGSPRRISLFFALQRAEDQR